MRISDWSSDVCSSDLSFLTSPGRFPWVYPSTLRLEREMTFKTTKLRDAITFALVAGATSLVGTGVAFAQDQDQDQEATSDTTTLDRIEVTGSRLKRAEIEGAMPVTIIDRATIDASGEVSVADYLRTTNLKEEHTSELQSLMRI